jgi:hypothetical protein
LSRLVQSHHVRTPRSCTDEPLPLALGCLAVRLLAGLFASARLIGQPAAPANPPLLGRDWQSVSPRS